MGGESVLVTGARGFIGKTLVARLASAGRSVIAVGRTTLQHFIGMENVECRISDLTTLDRLPDSVTTVIHCAATSPQAGVTASAIIRDNVCATRQLVELSCRANVKRFIFLSSVSAFGQIKEPVLDEIHPSVDPDLYGLTKRIGEELLAASATEMASLALRLPGIVGHGAGRNWLTRVKADIEAGREVKAFNLDHPYNNAVHVDDLCEFLLSLASASFQGFDMITLGAAGAIPLARALQLLMQSLGRKVPIIEVEAAGRRSFIIDSKKASRRYGYHSMRIEEVISRYGGTT